MTTLGEHGGKEREPKAIDGSPEGMERFFQRYADDPLLFRVLMRFSFTNTPLDCDTDLAAPLGAHASAVRKSLVSLVLEGFVIARKHDGVTAYMLTTDAPTRLVAGELLRLAIERGVFR